MSRSDEVELFWRQRFEQSRGSHGVFASLRTCEAAPMAPLLGSSTAAQGG